MYHNVMNRNLPYRYRIMHAANSFKDVASCSMREYTIFLLSSTVFFLFADQNLLAPNLSLIAHEFRFDDHERDEKLGGYVAFGFFIVGAPIALIVGYLTDMMNRCTLFGMVVILGSSSSLATYWVKNYSQLLICRIFTGISIGGINPVIFSLIGDLYPDSSRVYVSTIIGISQSAGVAGGQFLAGMIGPTLGWRLPFLLVAVPSIMCAMLVFFTVLEPRRGEQEKAVQSLREDNYHKGTEIPEINVEEKPSSEDITYAVASSVEEVRAVSPNAHTERYSEKIECSKVLGIFRTASALIIFVQGFPGCLPWGLIFVFLNDYFSSDLGLTVQAATAALTCFGVGGLFGQLFGGWFGQRLYNQDPRFQALLMGISTILAVGPVLYLLNAPQPVDPTFYIVGFLGGFVVNINGPNVRVVLQNVCKPEVRGTAFAFFALADDIGKGLGPAIVVLFIQAFKGNKRKAFNLIVLFWIFCGSMLLLLAFTVIHDENQVQKSVKDSMMRRPSIDRSSEYNPIHSPDLRSQVFYLRIMDENSPTKPSIVGVSTITEKIRIEYESKEKVFIHSH